MFDKLPKDFSEIVSRNNGLSRYLTALIDGRETTPRSWLYEHRDSGEVLQRWLSMLEYLKDGSSFEQLVYYFDTAQLGKWGPMGGIAPIADLQDLLKAGFTDEEPPLPQAFKTSEWQQAKTEAIAYLRSLGLRNLRPRSYETVVDDMNLRDTLESNAGWPDFQRRSIDSVRKQAITDAENGNWRNYPAIALFRNYYGKTRLVWMFPMSVNIVEGSFTQPLMNALTKSVNLANPFFSPWVGFEMVKKVVTVNYDKHFLYASDFSSTDAHFNLATTREMIEVVAALFQDSARSGLTESLVRLHTIPLVCGLDSIQVGYHGVASGSNWTNLIESLFDLVFSIYVEIKTSVKGLYAIGDDMSWLDFEFSPQFKTDLETLGLGVGQVIRSDKTTAEMNYVKTLQRLFIRGYRNTTSGLLRGIYPTIRALNSSVNPERFHSPKLWTSDMFCARQFMILENCVDHPLFEEFVQYVVLGQKDLIPFAKLKRSVLDSIRRETRLLPGLNPSYNQEKRGYSFADFESIRIASRM